MRLSQQNLASLLGALTASVNVVMTSSAAAAVAGLQCLSSDGQSCRRRETIGHSIRVSQFTIADSDSWFDKGWFWIHFRCSKSSFDTIVEIIYVFWDIVNSPIGHNAFFHRERVEVCLHYLTYAGSIIDSAKVFGMSKASASGTLIK